MAVEESSTTSSKSDTSTSSSLSSKDNNCDNSLSKTNGDESSFSMPTQVLYRNLSCPICLQVLTQAICVRECLHRFCKECLDMALIKNGKSCPVCRVAIQTRRHCRADTAVDELILNLGLRENVEKMLADPNYKDYTYHRTKRRRMLEEQEQRKHQPIKQPSLSKEDNKQLHSKPVGLSCSKFDHCSLPSVVSDGSRRSSQSHSLSNLSCDQSSQSSKTSECDSTHPASKKRLRKKQRPKIRSSFLSSSAVSWMRSVNDTVNHKEETPQFGANDAFINVGSASDTSSNASTSIQPPSIARSQLSKSKRRRSEMEKKSKSTACSKRKKKRPKISQFLNPRYNSGHL